MSNGAWEAAKLSASRRPLLAEGEVELAMQEAHSVSPAAAPEQSHSGALTLTSHRLVWTDHAATFAIALPLAKIALFRESSGGLIKKSHKLTLRLGKEQTDVVLHFGSKCQLTDKLAGALAARRWERPASPCPPGGVANSTSPSLARATTPSTSPAPQMAAPAMRAGIGGLERMQEERHQAVDVALATAFRDIDALQERAEELVRIARQIQQARPRDGAEDPELNAMLQQAGLAVPVTKKAAGSLYFTELARQLSDVCVAVLKKSGPMIALPDLFCLYNRARGVEMISPEDLLRACELMEDLALPVRLHRFPSGVLVVRLAEAGDEAVSAELGRLAAQRGPVTAVELARLRNMPLSLAREQLLAAERSAVLCRDETFEGVTFYANFFPQAVQELQRRSAV
eukprot:m51a1_g4680 hypothetical protein (400) ;mRNA; r:162668-164369